MASVALASSVLAGYFSGATAAQAVLAGAVIACLGQGYLTWRVFRFGGGRHARRVVSEMYRGAAGKFLITVIGFGWVFSAGPEWDARWIFTGFILQQLTIWVVPFTMPASAPERVERHGR